MAILFRIMKHDLRLLAADRTLWVIVALFALLIGYGVFNGERWARKRAHSVSELQARSERAFAKSRAELVAIENGSTPATTNPPAAALPTGKSISVSLPPGPLAALCSEDPAASSCLTIGFGQGCLAAAARPLDEQRLAAAERVGEVDEGAALDDVARVSEQLHERIGALALDRFAWVYARFGEVLLNHLFCSFNTASAMRRSSGVIRGIAARIFSGESEERISANSSSVSVSPLSSASGSASTACASFGRSVIITKPGVPAGAFTNRFDSGSMKRIDSPMQEAVRHRSLLLLLAEEAARHLLRLEFGEGCGRRNGRNLRHLFIASRPAFPRAHPIGRQNEEGRGSVVALRTEEYAQIAYIRRH
jgi:hypothetical protein